MKIYKIKVNGKTYKVELEAYEEVASSTPAPAVEAKQAPAPAANKPASGDGTKVLAPIQGTVVNVKVKVGDKVKKGDAVVVVEAMKLENDVGASVDGEIVEICVSKGASVSTGDVLVVIK